jgi:uncharacterized protein YndB with AHSA1/START domain
MSFQDDPTVIRWRLHLASPPDAVYKLLNTDEGRASFWAEFAVETNRVIHFIFPNGMEWKGKILERIPPKRFTVNYFGNSTTSFTLLPTPSGGTDLTLTDEGIPDADRSEVIAGWVSVLLALKAAVDFGVDLRNHDLTRTWDEGFAEN